jgi:prevent-host-death family protein
MTIGKERSGMSEQAPTVQTVSASKARQDWSELLDQVYRRHARVLVEAEGVPVAAIVSAEDLEQLTRLEAQREADLGLLDETQAAFAGVPAEELAEQVASAISAVRQQSRRRRPQAS